MQDKYFCPSHIYFFEARIEPTTLAVKSTNYNTNGPVNQLEDIRNSLYTANRNRNTIRCFLLGRTFLLILFGVVVLLYIVISARNDDVSFKIYASSFLLFVDLRNLSIG